MSLYNLFSIPIWNTNFESIDNKEIAKHCQEVKKLDKGRDISNVGGWQSNDLKGPHQPLYEFHKKLNETAGFFATDTNIQQPIGLTNMWMNINGYKDYNKLHCHSHCQLSGVYYVQVTENTGDIHFRHPAMPRMEYEWNTDKVEYWEDADGNNGRKFNQYNSCSWTYKPVAGQLLIFPSWLEHFTSPNLEKDVERITISFNYHSLFLEKGMTRFNEETNSLEYYTGTHWSSVR